MQVILAKNWWPLVIRGLAAILLGVITVVRNAISIDELALLFFVYALFDGVVGIAGAARAGEAHSRWTNLVIEGLTGIGAAVAVITLRATGAVLPLESVIAAWALATGVLEIAAARQLRNHIAGEWLLALSGTASLALGIMTIALPRPNTAWNCIPRRRVRICVWNSADRTGIPPPIMVEKIRSQSAGERPGAHRMIVP